MLAATPTEDTEATAAPLQTADGQVGWFHGDGGDLAWDVASEAPAENAPSQGAAAFAATVEITVTPPWPPETSTLETSGSDLRSAHQRMDRLDARLGRIENRLMELSTLIARNFNATFATPLEPTEATDDGGRAPQQTPVSTSAPLIEAASRFAPQHPGSPQPVTRLYAKRDRDGDEGLEAFLDSLTAKHAARR